MYTNVHAKCTFAYWSSVSQAYAAIDPSQVPTQIGLLCISLPLLKEELEILPDDPRSKCEECNAGILHKQVACPQKGDKRKRESVPGELKKATKKRIPTLLAAVIGRALIRGRERSEVQELEARRKRKR